MDLDSKRSNIKALYFDAHPHIKKSRIKRKRSYSKAIFFSFKVWNRCRRAYPSIHPLHPLPRNYQLWLRRETFTILNPFLSNWFCRLLRKCPALSLFPTLNQSLRFITQFTTGLEGIFLGFFIEISKSYEKPQKISVLGKLYDFLLNLIEFRNFQ